MAHVTSMKHIGSRNLGVTVECMEWSNKMDLIAIGTDKGELIVQRLNWQKVITYPPPAEEVRVRSLTWHQEHSIIAAGYSNGKFILLDVENEDLVLSIDYEEDIRKVIFTKPVSSAKEVPPEVSNTMKFLSELPPISGFGLSHKIKRFHHKSLSFLVVITSSGHIHLLLFGGLKVGSIDMRKYVNHPENFEIYNVGLNSSCTGLYIQIRDGPELCLFYMRNPALAELGAAFLLQLSMLCTDILETKTYINEATQCVLESWESVLIEMDNKLTKYANNQVEGALSADLLELLLFGYAAHEIEEFLMEELTEKGLKKLATSVDLSYTTMQGLVSKQLQSAGMHLLYYFSTVKGLAKKSFIFNNFLNEEMALEALRACGALLMKILELQQIIDQSVNDMKLFFSWLLVVIIRLHQQDISDDVPQLGPEDTIYLAEYLNTLEDLSPKAAVKDQANTNKRKFNLEKIGQYFEDKPLRQTAKSDIHQVWHKLLDENECLNNCKLIYHHEKKASLIQQRNSTYRVIDEIFSKPSESISSSFECLSKVICGRHSCDSVEGLLIRTSYFMDTSDDDKPPFDVFITTLNPWQALYVEFHLNQKELRHLLIDFKPKLKESLNIRFVDLQFYNSQTVSMLLEQRHGDKAQQSCFFVQMPLAPVKENLVNTSIDGTVDLAIPGAEYHLSSSILDADEHNNQLEGIYTDLAVSGNRKVAALLTERRRKMTTYEMEIEDDDEDAEISQNSLLEISKESAAS